MKKGVAESFIHLSFNKSYITRNTFYVTKIVLKGPFYLCCRPTDQTYRCLCVYTDVTGTCARCLCVYIGTCSVDTGACAPALAPWIQVLMSTLAPALWIQVHVCLHWHLYRGYRCLCTYTGTCTVDTGAGTVDVTSGSTVRSSAAALRLKGLLHTAAHHKDTIIIKNNSRKCCIYNCIIFN